VSPTPDEVSPSIRVRRLLSRLTLADKVRQLLVVSFAGPAVPKAMIRRVRPGGVIYFADNLVDARQVAHLSRSLQRVSRRNGLPLLVGTDQEGGSVTRLPTRVSRLPGGATFQGDARWVWRVAYKTGSAMRRMGLNLDFAPVADVNTVGTAGVIGARSFGSRPRVVSRLVRAQVCGYHGGGVAATVKHFPGHGSTRVDSHVSLPVLDLARRTWLRVHVPPFQRGIAAGTDAAMVGHLAFPRLDPTGRPASLSRPLVTQWLRKRLGFSGVVVTDSLEMGAVVARGTSAEIAVRAISAGVDLLLMPPDPNAAVRGLLRAVRDGRVAVSRINRSVERVLSLKDRLGLLGSPRRLAQC
jgi:beta-N-acetylhexosaminidase